MEKFVWSPPTGYIEGSATVLCYFYRSSTGGDPTLEFRAYQPVASAGNFSEDDGFCPDPDFVVTSISLSPISPTEGGTFSATVKVKNEGTASGDAGYLDIWKNEPSSPGCGSTGTRSKFIGTLSAGESKTVPFYNIDAATAGSRTFRAFVDGGCDTYESSESNNQKTKSYTVIAAKPDFVVTSISLSPSSPTEGSTFNATVKVRNEGTASGNAHYLDVWTNKSSSPSCGSSGTDSEYIGTLSVGQSKTVTFSGLSAGSAGNKTFRAFIDSECQTAEPDDSNNQKTKSYTVIPADPDFVVTSISLSPSSPTEGSTFNATVTVKNEGAGSGNAGYLDVWTNKSSSASCGSSGTENKYVGTLSVGQSKTFTFAGLSAGSAGNKTFRAFIDSECQTAEPNDSNNQKTKSYTVIPAKPDFVVTSISLSPTSPLQSGTTFSATVTVRNLGSAFGNGGYVEVWRNKLSSADCRPVGDAQKSVGTLSVGQSKTFTFTGLSAGSLVGTKTFRAFVDSGCATAEPDESNNQKIKSYTVTHEIKPDFVVTSISLSPATPVVDEPFRATVTVKNKGTASGNAGYLDVWTNKSSSASCASSGTDSEYVGTLSTGQSKTVTFTGFVFSSPGVRNFRAFIDSKCQTPESSNSNNQRTRGYEVKPGREPDFVVSSISLSPPAPVVDETFRATVTVKNEGTASGNAGYLDVWTNKSSSASCASSGTDYKDVGTLSADQSKTFTFSGLSAGSAGSKTFRAFIDTECQTPESNDGNNQKIKSYTVTHEIKPDFVVTSISLSPSSPTQGSTFNATVTVKNQGTASGNAGYLDVWTNKSSSASCGSSGTDSEYVGTLSADQSKTFTFSGLNAGSAGCKTFRAFIDSECQTAESNESNNQKTKSNCPPVPCVADDACDDADPCTEDECVDGECINMPIHCDDGDPCTADSCDPATGCGNDPIDCDDNNLCTHDSCDPISGCVNTLIDCDDGVFCNGEESCDPDTGQCVEREEPCDPDTQLCDEGSDECKPDSDRDGVRNEIDECPGTPRGASVDPSDGCRYFRWVVRVDGELSTESVPICEGSEELLDAPDPPDGQVFHYWTGDVPDDPNDPNSSDGLKYSNPLPLEMDSDKNLEAHFQAIGSGDDGGPCGSMGSGCGPTGPATILILLGMCVLRFVGPGRSHRP
jgi:subtilase family serine protease